MEKLVLIDGNSLINRAFYAMPVLSTKDGTFTNAVYGFMNMFFKMLSDTHPDYVAVAFDLKDPTFRHKMYSEYKGTRKPMPMELRPQIPLLKDLLHTMGVKTFELSGREADDIIGTIAKHTDIKTIIITGDKDSFQLVDEQTEIHFTRRGITDTEIYNNENFTEKTSLVPRQIIDLKALMGDASDNIPGVSGIGEKTAKTLLHQYDNVENLYNHTDELKGKLKEKIINGKDMAFLSKTLATIDCDCTIDTDTSKMTISLPFSKDVKRRFVELEFKSLYKKNEWFTDGETTAPNEVLSNYNQSNSQSDNKTDDQSDNKSCVKSDNNHSKNSPLTTVSKNSHTLPSDNSVQSDYLSVENSEDSDNPVSTDFSSVKIIEIQKTEDINTILTNSDVDRIAITKTQHSINFSDGRNEYRIPVKETLLDDGFSLSEVLKALEALFNGDKKLICFDKKETRHYILSAQNINFSAYSDDVSIMKYLADFTGADETLADVIAEYNLSDTYPATSLFVSSKILLKKLKDNQMTGLYYDVELPLADVLFDMEISGFKVDYKALCEAGEKYHKILSDLEGKIREYASSDTLNVNSPKQLGEILFEKLKIGKGKKTKTGYSTSYEVLENLEDAHPIVPLILKYRQLQKLNSTYVEGFKPLIDKKTGLLHTSFNQTVTATGRLSSKEPNLQNIPVRDEEGKELRRFFVPKTPDRILISADYSQIELRLLAAFSGCESLIKAFNHGEDIHRDTASKVFGVPPEQVTPSMRSNAKAVNFGIIYGISEFGLAKNLKISVGQARNYINSYFMEYPEVREYMDANVDFAKEHGYARTMLGRKRYIRELSSPNYNLRSFGERVAMNMPLQGSSADIIKLAMINVAKRLKEENLKSELILQVHDELIVDAFISEKEQVEKILTEEMEGAVKLSVPLTVSKGCGKTWFDAK